MVGVRYCGGCNPTFDRAALVRQLAGCFPTLRFECARPGVCYPLVLVVCGCPARCVDGVGPGQKAEELISLSSPAALPALKRRLRQMLG